MNEHIGKFDADDEPLFNIGAVSRMTGVTETTLRVWERRYDFPASVRTDGGHRLYSQHEVVRVQWVKAQVDAGLQVSQAIKTLQHHEQEGRFPGAQSASQSNDTNTFAAFYERLLKALLEHDLIASDHIIAEALTVYPLEHLILHILSPILDEIGASWERGELDIATEHMVTNFIRHRLLQWMRTGPPAYEVNPVVLACAPGELHEGSLLMLGVLLRRLRWPVSYLGQTVALHDFAAFVEKLQPSAIVFVAMMEPSAQALSEWPRLLPQVYKAKQPIVCFGGRIFVVKPETVKLVPGVFLGNSVEEGLKTLNKLLSKMYPLAQ
jgi:DNA-binding transcriptional MerR regulator